MKLKSKYKIGGHWYKVIFPYKFKERTDIDGQCDNSLLEIRLIATDGMGNEIPMSKVIEIFCHEVLHAIDAVYNAGKLENDTVARLGNGLYQFLNDNGFLK